MGTLLGPATANSTLNPSLYDDRSNQVVGASIALIILPTFVVFLRLLSRWISHAGFWWDDAAVVLSMIFAWGPNIVNLLFVHHGLGQHLAVQSTETIFVNFKLLYAFEFLYILAISTVKYAILLFEYRIFPILQFRNMVKAALAFTVALTTACILVSIFQCTPIHDFWDTLTSRLRSQLGGRCINVESYFLIAGGINTATQFIFLALPIPILWRLKTTRSQKLLLTGIFGVGLIVCVVGVARLAVLSRANINDFTWSYVPVAVWTAAEPSAAVISACLPSLRPLFVRGIFRGCTRRSYKPSSSSTSSHNRNLLHSPLGHNEKSRAHFRRLQDSRIRDQSQQLSGANEVEIQARKGRENYDWAGQEEYDLGEARGASRKNRPESTIVDSEVPAGRIRARTEVVISISERVDWKDDLF